MNRFNLLATAAASIVAAPACAQSTEDGGEAEIVVTGLRTETVASRVGMSIQAIGSDQLEREGVRDPEDLVRLVPGLSYAQSSYGPPVYTIRGVGFYDPSLGAPPAVSLSMDEAPLPYSLLAAGATMDLERVEVLKGPQGTLFGQNSTGGAINLVAAKPTDTPTWGGGLSVGRFWDTQIDGFVSGPLGSTVKARVSVRAERSDDWQRSYTRDDALGEKDMLAARAIVDWEPREDLLVRLSASGWRDRSDTQAGQFLAITNTPSRLPAALVAYPAAPDDPRAADWDRGEDFVKDTSYWQASLRSELSLGAAKITSISTFQHLDRDDLMDADGTAVANFNVRAVGRLDIASQELRVSGTTGGVRWIAGGNYQHERIRDAVLVDFPDSSFPFDGVDAKTRQRVETWAAFANANYSILPTLRIEAGARYTDEVRRYSACSYDDGSGTGAAYINRVATLLSGRPVNVPPGGCATLDESFTPTLFQDDIKDQNWSWRAGIEWDAAPGLLGYVNVSEGHKSGAFSTIGATSTRQLAPAVPESVLAVEGGLKARLAQGRLQISGAAFYYDYTDKQLRGKKIDPRLGPLSGLINVPRSEVVGGEIEIAARPLAGLQLRAGATYVHSRIIGPFQNYDGLGRLAELGGEAFPLTPPWQLTGSADYEAPLSGALQGFVGTTAAYQDGTNSALGELPLLRLGAYTLVDLRAGVRAGPGWEVGLYVRNLFDENYATFVSTISPDVANRLAGRPRTYGLSVRFRR
jgi:iron complex outermembrane recepter protein